MCWLDRQVHLLAPKGVRRSAGESVLAVFLVDADVAQGWQLREQLLERAAAHHVILFAGLASWPVQGSTPMNVLAAAAAALADEQASFHASMGEEVKLEIEGLWLPLGVAGDFLTG